ncbi:MAG: hypothetical protein OEW34_02190 [Burkholderiaceae bacterium]|jgi:hypothetical protein|nr:hypothetical protein [Burkholderiaceae bacterium]
MPIAIFSMLVFAIFTWLGAGMVEAVMRDFASEIGMRTWVFIAVPGLLAMLFSLLLFHDAARRITKVQESMSRALLVGIATWLAVTAMISFMWCPGYRMLRCSSDVLLVTGVVGGGPLLAAVLLAGLVIGLVLRRRVGWLQYEAERARRSAGSADAE